MAALISSNFAPSNHPPREFASCLTNSFPSLPAPLSPSSLTIIPQSLPHSQLFTLHYHLSSAAISARKIFSTPPPAYQPSTLNHQFPNPRYQLLHPGYQLSTL